MSRRGFVDRPMVGAAASRMSSRRSPVKAWATATMAYVITEGIA